MLLETRQKGRSRERDRASNKRPMRNKNPLIEVRKVNAHIYTFEQRFGGNRRVSEFQPQRFTINKLNSLDTKKRGYSVSSEKDVLVVPSHSPRVIGGPSASHFECPRG